MRSPSELLTNGNNIGQIYIQGPPIDLFSLRDSDCGVEQFQGMIGNQLIKLSDVLADGPLITQTFENGDLENFDLGSQSQKNGFFETAKFNRNTLYELANGNATLSSCDRTVIEDEEEHLPMIQISKNIHAFKIQSLDQVSARSNSI